MTDNILDNKVDTPDINPNKQVTLNHPNKAKIGRLWSSPVYHLAAGLHQGQLRWQYEDYINHPLRIATKLLEVGYPIDYVHCALLHDVIEDTNATYELLENYVSDRVIEAIKLLTNEGIPYDEYLDRLLSSENVLALTIKTLDASDNANLSDEALKYLQDNNIDPEIVTTKYKTVAKECGKVVKKLNSQTKNRETLRVGIKHLML